MKRLAFLLSATLATSPALAQDMPLGCYGRDYSDAHLASHPGQGIDWITINFYPSPYADQGATETWADITVMTANQGQAARDGVGGMILTETAINFGGMVKVAFVHRYLRLCAP